MSPLNFSMVICTKMNKPVVIPKVCTLTVKGKSQGTWENKWFKELFDVDGQILFDIRSSIKHVFQQVFQLADCDITCMLKMVMSNYWEWKIMGATIDKNITDNNILFTSEILKTLQWIQAINNTTLTFDLQNRQYNSTFLFDLHIMKYFKAMQNHTTFNIGC